ncbi:glutamine-hydrolyzing carbamoyl-phosphate synthase small subunit [Candidatus Igneacidithiobacillus taiwanensis]|uniref:glutamine-hydrolyzing carbamoyl-phosphate synthase small subunit n=1 Tax=Candidatus Igneacidithiobacillus taiwanensis TaxID=1945924 RepID=UPI00289A3B23|nr:glutamine-hydrolyzing carbamoyl-phosphate synthase small subunit [Candidatus Igneacidithiobacillus taiwanensis]MCE5360026.1 glutamine-hydrolyzing carbamoyl-phosphate synthase small subunit [Acidithiobacillus sp.]
MDAVLALSDGRIFYGTGFGAAGMRAGEVCFNTAMTGYQEILTDPSYRGQIITLTYPHIGNVGVNEEDQEGREIFCSGLLLRTLPRAASSWRAQENLDEYLRRHGIPGMAEFDTRALTRHLREHGAQNGALAVGEKLQPEAVLAAARAFPGLEGADLIGEVTLGQHQSWRRRSPDPAHGYHSQEVGNYPHHVVVVDFGAKRNILRLLADRGCRVTLLPHQSSSREILAVGADGVLFSNGPGDPAALTAAQQTVRAVVEAGQPTFGLCLGHQLLGLALGGKTEKMKFGHHGANHPVRDLRSGRVLITSQNHGFAVAAESLPNSMEPTHVSLFDGSLQGMRHRELPAFSFQGHPEAGPGPHDASVIFDEFVASFRTRKDHAPA